MSVICENKSKVPTLLSSSLRIYFSVKGEMNEYRWKVEGILASNWDFLFTDVTERIEIMEICVLLSVLVNSEQPLNT